MVFMVVHIPNIYILIISPVNICCSNQSLPICSYDMQDKKIPMQSVLESKYLAGQKIYRFGADDVLFRETSTSNVEGKKEPAIYQINFTCMDLLNITTQQKCRVTRRPLFVDEEDCLHRIL